MILVLFTGSYPYDYSTEQTFLDGEVRILVKKFDRVILVPRVAKGKLLPLVEGVEVDTSFAESFTFVRRVVAGLKSLFSKDFRQDIKNQLPKSLSPLYGRRLFSFLAGAELTRIWVLNWLKKQTVTASSIVFYTFWFDEITMGIGLAKEIATNLRVVSRTHGYDLYEELYGVWPCRFRAISLLDGLFADSDIGTNYLKDKYPQFKNKYETMLLGVPDPGGVSKPSQDGVLRICSCSIINPVKRIDLIFHAVVVAAQMRDTQQIEWRHYGDGQEISNYIKRIKNEFPSNAKGYFPGYKTQQILIQDYLENPVDVFINVSSTEGTPVSIMEAISCGIPIIATSVGGNVEIVSQKNGFLLSANPDPREIAEILLKVCDLTDEIQEKRQASREVWLERYNETTNFELFAKRLIEIRKS
ncbi:MAG: glycosyltransferase [Anaerolineales bacterium]